MGAVLPHPEERGEPGLSVQRLQPGGEDAVVLWAVPPPVCALAPLRLYRVHAGATWPVAAGRLAGAVLAPVRLLQRPAQQRLVPQLKLFD